MSEHEEDIVQLMQEKELSQEDLELELCTDITGERGNRVDTSQFISDISCALYP